MAFTVAAVAPGSPVAPASFAEVAADGGAVRASLEADGTPFAEVAPDGGAVRASLEADAAGVDLPRPIH
ncbi:hypothetical protein BCR15_10150 [Tessaracoccus lapidicaptus]|uniref:Uncharacterized protein n=1 Tax=Tessaracoccus lapidicaptus TaxID=1427523 RepID=A0A1C0AGK6_9ACTN|nr:MULTISPECIES: hypothetical protein [Tessaracoccus]AQX14926.1 hypothetical protein BKM78_02530 [Tessaracoccus sp. T2.5-30]OCL30832.1 hypothetical protein BCR15_10150 [Tessaracoccus lapidicaptus]VEP39087.1 hypothetical protein TLA_TLA_00514 [Tessaracoccus lapidicaptus]